MNTATPQTSDQVLAVVDNVTRIVWYVGAAASIESACDFVARTTGRTSNAAAGLIPAVALEQGAPGYEIHDATGLPQTTNERDEHDAVLAAPLLRTYRLAA